MLDSICAGIAAVTTGIQAVADTGKWIFNLNYCLVSTVAHYFGKFFGTAAHYVGILRLALAAIWGYVSHFVLEIYGFLGSVCILMLKLATHIYDIGSLAYLNICSACEDISDFFGNGSMWVKCAVVTTYSLLAAGASHSASFIVASVSTLIFIVASLVGACVNIINVTWNGLGFALSSVASFPSFLSQSANNLWKRAVENVAGLLMATTKETYLGVVMLCLVYLTLSNFMRFFSCQSLPLFSRRVRRRRHRASPPGDPLQFDRGFESDFEDDVFGLGLEGRNRHHPPWLNDLNDRDSDQVDNNTSSDTSDNDVSDNDDIDDDANDSDEYTVESDNEEEDDDDDSSDDADSIHSHNSRTVSTASSEHDIEVQLPPIDQHYSLRSRSSTPARYAGGCVGLNSQEDYTWEVERERDKRKCVVCQDEIKSVLLLPCRHMCMCVRCADQIVRSRIAGRKTCPLCRTKITKVMNIYV